MQIKVIPSKIIFLLLPLLALGGFLLSCTGSKKPHKAELQFEATVQYRDLEGGAWILESNDGTTYEPMNLPEAYKEEGLSVRVWANRAEEQASIRMMGPIISIERIERSSPD